MEWKRWLIIKDINCKLFVRYCEGISVTFLCFYVCACLCLCFASVICPFDNLSLSLRTLNRYLFFQWKTNTQSLERLKTNTIRTFSWEHSLQYYAMVHLPIWSYHTWNLHSIPVPCLWRVAMLRFANSKPDVRGHIFRFISCTCCTCSGVRFSSCCIFSVWRAASCSGVRSGVFVFSCPTADPQPKKDVKCK